MDIKRINENDFSLYSSQIESLFNDSVRINFPGFDAGDNYGARRCDEVIKYLKDGTAIVFVAVDNDEVVGWIWCHEIIRIGCRRLHIAEVAVNERYRKMGVATELLDKVEEYAKQNNYSEIELFVSSSNLAAVNFYKKSSFDIERYQMYKKVCL